MWDVEDGKEFEVVNVNGELPLLKFGETAYTATEPEHLTHQRPVLDADGVPIKVGDTVYEVGKNYPPFIVGRLPEPGAYRSVMVMYPNGNFTYLDPERITHTKPDTTDSWEKWREDFIKPPCIYCRDILGVEFDNDTELDKAFDAQIQDMEHRARALAERGE